jgi:hypothetical protein
VKGFYPFVYLYVVCCRLRIRVSRCARPAEIRHPLSPDRHAITQLHTRVDVEAIAVTKGETDRGAAVARLSTLVPPTRVDLVDEVMARIGTRRRTARTGRRTASSVSW